MLISHSHKFIFIHVAKVAGLSIKKALEEYSQEPDKFKIKRPPRMRGGTLNPLYAMWQGYLLHATAWDTKRALADDVFERYFTFGFVRNPWDWQVSMYHFILADDTHIHNHKVRAMGGFDEYLDWVVSTDKPFAKVATKWQTHMLADANGEILVDFVGRFETLPDDFATICRTVGLDAKLPHVNKTRHRDYRSYYTAAARDLVAEHFARDIAGFGYTFDGYEHGKGQVGLLREPGNRPGGG